MDETWIHHYTPESNRSSAEWREAGESRSKRVKASRWAETTSPSRQIDHHRTKSLFKTLIQSKWRRGEADKQQQ
ncbi:hypothetical protein ACLKA7_001319 [Drosophila subpalustris]